jgi:hypothetical protein
MKVASITLSVICAVVALAADEAKPAAPAKPPVRVTPAKPDPARPPTLTLDGKPAPIAPDPQNPGSPVAPPGGENSAPAITLQGKNAPPAPGIYLASPYTGIIVVPGPIDSQMMKPIAPSASEIPRREPELKLTPKKK